jgi:hypothetical protein
VGVKVAHREWLSLDYKSRKIHLTKYPGTAKAKVLNLTFLPISILFNHLVRSQNPLHSSFRGVLCFLLTDRIKRKGSVL